MAIIGIFTHFEQHNMEIWKDLSYPLQVRKHDLVRHPSFPGADKFIIYEVDSVTKDKLFLLSENLRVIMVREESLREGLYEFLKKPSE